MTQPHLPCSGEPSPVHLWPATLQRFSLLIHKNSAALLSKVSHCIVSECFLRLGGLFENQTLNPGSINAMQYQLTEKAKDLIHKSEILF